MLSPYLGVVPGSWFLVCHPILTKLEGICKKNQKDFASLTGVFFLYFLGPVTLVPGVFSYLSVYCFSSTLIGPKNLIFGMPPYFDPTRSKKEFNTQGTRAGPGFHDRTLAVKSRKNTRKSAFVKINYEGSKKLVSWVSPKWVKSRKHRRKKMRKKMLQRLGVAQAAVTERWP